MKSEKQKAEFKSGLFIILTLVLLIFSILWLRYFAITPEKKIIARFTETGPVESGMPVYYQGVNVGSVPKVGFSEDYRYTYVYMNIYHKGLELPANVTATVKTEGITGQKYVNVSYPEKPVDEMLASGDIIEGKKPFGIDDFQEFIKKEVESGRLQKMFKDIETTLANANAATAGINRTSSRVNYLMAKYDRDINDIIKTTSGTVQDLNRAVTGVNRVVESPEIQEGVRETVENMNNLVLRTDANTQRVFNQVYQTRLIPNINATVGKTYMTLDDAQATIRKAGETACTYNCVGENLSKMLSQRFLLFKLMFGRPGAALDECEDEVTTLSSQ